MKNDVFTCISCNVEKSIDQFKPHSRRRYGHSETCLECIKNNKILRDRKYHYNHGKERYRRNILSSKNNSLLRRYGISLDKYNQMCDSQNNKCAICKRSRKLVVDHSHKTGLVRELLCNACNSVLGHFHENIEVLQNAIQYVQKWQGK